MSAGRHKPSRLRLYAQATASALLLVGLLIALLEAGIAFNVLPDVVQQSSHETLDDPYLGSRYVPNTFEHDANGWRNASVPAAARVVCIGDSLTYGVSASRSDAYPQQLSGLLNEPVYNMARGTYSPVEYAYLVDEALTFNPDVLIIGLYLGNDLAGCFQATERPAWADLRATDYDSAAHPLTATIHHWNIIVGVRSGDIAAAAAAAAQLQTPASETVATPEAQPPPVEQPGGFTLNLRSLAYLRYVLFPPPVNVDDYAWYSEQAAHIMAFAEATGLTDTLLAYEDDQIFTQFTPAYRDAALDRSEPAIAEGYRICADRLAAIQRTCEEAGVHCLFVLLPTKERVYAPYLAAQGFELPATYAALMRHEGEAQADFSAFLDEIGAASLDVTPALQAAALQAAADGHLIYRHDTDGHPTGAGYRVIAQAIAAALDDLGWLDE